MTTVGAGKFTYTYIQDWANMPADRSLGTVSAIATDSQDRVYAFQRAEPPVVIFNRNGEFLSSWGNGNFVDPHGLFIKDDIVYLTDREGSTAMRYTLDGKPLQIIGTLGEYSDTGCEVTGAVCPRSAGPFNYITEMVPHPSGDLYISDGYRNARVHRFSKDGTLVSSWGEPGKGGPTTSSTCPTASWLVRTAASIYVTGRTAASRCSPLKANTSPCGPTCSARWTYPKTWKGILSSASGSGRMVDRPR